MVYNRIYEEISIKCDTWMLIALNYFNCTTEPKLYLKQYIILAARAPIA
jgi:hypothetical protein